MNISLKPELEQFVTQQINTGQYADANELVNVALEVLRDQNECDPLYEAYLRRELKIGIDQLDAGQYSSFTAESIIADERRRLGRVEES